MDGKYLSFQKKKYSLNFIWQENTSFVGGGKAHIKMWSMATTTNTTMPYLEVTSVCGVYKNWWGLQIAKRVIGSVWSNFYLS